MDNYEIAELDEFKTGMAALKEKADFLPIADTKEGYDASKRIHLDFRKVENNIEKIRKDKKAYFIEGGRQVDTQAKALMAQIEALRIPHTEAYQAIDKAKKEREQQRVQAIEERIEYMRLLPESLADSSSEEVKQAMLMLESEECLDFSEFTERALKCRNESRSQVAALFERKLKQEAEAAELERLRKEAEERTRIDREEQIKRDAAAKAEAEAQAAKMAEQAAKEAEAKAKQELAEAQERAKREAEEAAEAARLAEIQRQEQAEQAAKAEQAKREADKAHIGSVRKAAKESLMLQGLTEAQAKIIVMAINDGKIQNVSINY